MRRYGVKCRSCDGSGFHREDYDEGSVLASCRCYRGTIVLKLEPEDEDRLIEQLLKNRPDHTKETK